MDEEHLKMAIEQDVDLLPLALIYAPKGLETARQIAGRMGGSYEHKITLENSLKWLREQCQSRKKGYYDIIVNLPQSNPDTPNPSDVPGDRTTSVGSNPIPEVFPPPGADMKSVMWFWNNVQRLTRFVFHGEVPASSRKWGVEHLRWLALQQKQGRTELDELLEQGKKEVEERKQN